jgi:hypothetical protein
MILKIVKGSLPRALVEESPILGDVEPALSFWTCNGVVIRNIFELANYLDGCSDEHFRYHVNEDNHKNDFAIWVREVIHDARLASALDSIIDKVKYTRTIKDRLRELTR